MHNSRKEYFEFQTHDHFFLYLCFLFSMYDVDGNGHIDLIEMTKIVKSIYNMMGPNQVTLAGADAVLLLLLLMMMMMLLLLLSLLLLLLLQQLLLLLLFLLRMEIKRFPQHASLASGTTFCRRQLFQEFAFNLQLQFPTCSLIRNYNA